MNKILQYNKKIKLLSIFVTLTVDWWLTAKNNVQKFGTFCNHGLMA